MRGKTGMGVGEESPVLSDLIGNFVVAKRKKKSLWPVEKLPMVALVLGGSVQGFSIFFSLSLPLSFSPSLVSKGASGQC